MPIMVRRGQPLHRAYGTGSAAAPPPLNISPNQAAAGAFAPRPLPGGTMALQLGGGIRPDGPSVDREGRRQPGGVGTDLTDPRTWRRPYLFT